MFEYAPHNGLIKALIALILSVILVGCANTEPTDTSEPIIEATVEPTLTPTTDVGQAVADAIYATRTAVALLPTTPPPTETPYPHPFRLEQVGQMGGAANFLALNGDMVYLLVGTRLVTVDVTNPAVPTIIGRSDILPGRPNKVAVHEQYALVGNDENQLWLFETPADGNPVIVRTFEADDPERPEIAYLPTISADYTGDYSFEVHEEFWAGDDLFLYVSKDGKIVDTALTPLPPEETFITYNLVVSGRYAYAAIGDGLRIFDLGTMPEKEIIFPEDGMFILRWQVAGELVTSVGTLQSGWYIPPLCVNGGYLDISFRYWSLDDPASPTRVETPNQPLPHCDSFPISSGWIMTRSLHKGYYEYLDTRDAANWIIRQIPFSSDPMTSDIYAANDEVLIFVRRNNSSGEADEPDDLMIFDISDPSQPVHASTYQVSEVQHPLYTPIQLIGSYLYLKESQRLVLDISDPANPHEVEPPNSSFWGAENIVIQDGLVYLAIANRLEIYALDDLRTAITTVELPDTFTMWISNGRLIASMGFVVAVFDIADPTSPRMLATADAPYYVYQAAAYGDYIYLHQVEQGVGIYKLVDN